MNRPPNRSISRSRHFGRLLEVNYFTRPDPASRKRAGITPRDIAQRFKLGGRTPRYERISVDFIEQRREEVVTSDDL